MTRRGGGSRFGVLTEHSHRSGKSGGSIPHEPTSQTPDGGESLGFRVPPGLFQAIPESFGDEVAEKLLPLGACEPDALPESLWNSCVEIHQQPVVGVRTVWHGFVPLCLSASTGA